MTDELTHVPEELKIPTGPGARLLVRKSEGTRGPMVGVAAQYRDRAGDWHLSRSGLLLDAETARKLAPALLAVAAGIDASPPEPAPTSADREGSRWP